MLFCTPSSVWSTTTAGVGPDCRGITRAAEDPETDETPCVAVCHFPSGRPSVVARGYFRRDPASAPTVACACGPTSRRATFLFPRVNEGGNR